MYNRTMILLLGLMGSQLKGLLGVGTEGTRVDGSNVEKEMVV